MAPGGYSPLYISLENSRERGERGERKREGIGRRGKRGGKAINGRERGESVGKGVWENTEEDREGEKLEKGRGERH